MISSGGAAPCGPSRHTASCDGVTQCNNNVTNLSETVTFASWCLQFYLTWLEETWWPQRGSSAPFLLPSFVEMLSQYWPFSPSFVSPTVFQTGCRKNLYVFSSAVNPKTLQIPNSQAQWDVNAVAVGSGLHLGVSVSLLNYTHDTIFQEKHIPILFLSNLFFL